MEQTFSVRTVSGLVVVSYKRLKLGDGQTYDRSSD
jgi:hypothetical protein